MEVSQSLLTIYLCCSSSVSLSLKLNELLVRYICMIFMSHVTWILRQHSPCRWAHAAGRGKSHSSPCGRTHSLGHCPWCFWRKCSTVKRNSFNINIKLLIPDNISTSEHCWAAVFRPHQWRVGERTGGCWPVWYVRNTTVYIYEGWNMFQTWPHCLVFVTEDLLSACWQFVDPKLIIKVEVANMN